MKRVRYYSGRFDPKKDTPVIPGLALTIERFTRLPIDSQNTVLAEGSKVGDPGVLDPNFTPPLFTKRGVTLADLQKEYDRADGNIRKGISKHMSDEKMRKYYQDLQSQNQTIQQKGS